MFDLCITEASPGVLGSKGTKAIFFRGTEEQRLKNKGNTGNFGEQGPYKIKILFLGNKPIFSRGTREHVPISHPPGGPHYISESVCRKHTWLSEDDVAAE